MSLNDEARERFDRIEQKLDRTLGLLNAHLTESGVRDAKLGEQMRTAYRRIDDHLGDHKDRRGWWIALWITAIGSALATAFNWIIGRRVE